MNKRGQALVEFVLIMPVMLFIVLTVYDFGMIFSNKNELENNSTDIVLLYKNGKSLDEIKQLYSGVDIAISQNNDYDKIELKKSIKITTPGLNRILGNPYQIVVERYINHE